MKISNNPPQHLSNFEVLEHFLEMKEANDLLTQRFETHQQREILRAHKHVPLTGRDRAEKQRELPVVPDVDAAELQEEQIAGRRGVSKELNWVQDEVIQYLCADYNVTARQTAHGVASLADRLQDYGLTKAELLQVCNIAPRSQVGIYLIIEEAETRLAQPYEETMNYITDEIIAPTLLPEVPERFWPYVSTVQATDIAQIIRDDNAGYEDEEMYGEEEEQFVHEAQWGAGHEGAIDDDVDEAMD